jgi:hypothetical protein
VINRVVIAHQRAARGAQRHIAQRAGGGGQRDARRGAAAGFAVDVDRAAHQLHQTLADRQPEPRAAGLCRRARERLEQALLQVRRDARSGVLHHEFEQRHIAFARAGLHVESNAAARGVLERIAEQVRQHLFQAQRVEVNHLRHAIGHREVEGELLAGRRARVGLAQRLDEQAQIEVLRVQLGAAGFEAGHIEHVVQQLRQRACGVGGDAQQVRG